MSQTEEDLTRYELIVAKKAQVEALEKSLKSGVGAKGKYSENEIAFLKNHIKELNADIKSRSVFNLDEAIEELGFCYDVGTKVQYLIASHLSHSPEKDYKPLHEEYSNWYMSVTFPMLYCPDIPSHYINFFSNAGHKKPFTVPSVEEFVDRLSGKTPPSPTNDFDGLIIKLEKLEEIIYRLEEKANLQVRQQIAKLEYDASTKYELRYSKSRELTLNGIQIARPDFMSENDQFLSFVFNDGNSWRNIPISELLQSMQVDKLSKTIHQILSDIGITGSIKDVFMPNVSSKGFEFRNPISHSFADENKLQVIDLKTIRSSKK